MAPRDQFRYSSLSLRRGPERNERRRGGPGSEGVDDFRIGWACGCHLRPSLQYRVDEVLLKREPYHANAVRPRLQHVDPWDVRGRDRHLREDQFHGNPAPHRGNLYAIPIHPSMMSPRSALVSSSMTPLTRVRSTTRPNVAAKRAGTRSRRWTSRPCTVSPPAPPSPTWARRTATRASTPR